jgi:hypothetical protein
MKSQLLEYDLDNILIDKYGDVYFLSLEKPNTDRPIEKFNYTYTDEYGEELNGKTIMYFKYKLELSDFMSVHECEIPTDETISFYKIAFTDCDNEENAYQFAFIGLKCIAVSKIYTPKDYAKYIPTWRIKVIQERCTLVTK